MTKEQFGILRALNGAYPPVSVLPPARAVPVGQAVLPLGRTGGLCGPFAQLLQFGYESSGLAIACGAVFEIQIEPQALQPFPMPVRVISPATGVEGPAGVPGELHRSPAVGLEPVSHGVVAEEQTKAAKLVVDQGVHGVEQ